MPRGRPTRAAVMGDVIGGGGGDRTGDLTSFLFPLTMTVDSAGRASSLSTAAGGFRSREKISCCSMSNSSRSSSASCLCLLRSASAFVVPEAASPELRSSRPLFLLTVFRTGSRSGDDKLLLVVLLLLLRSCLRACCPLWFAPCE